MSEMAWLIKYTLMLIGLATSIAIMAGVTDFCLIKDLKDEVHEFLCAVTHSSAIAALCLVGILVIELLAAVVVAIAATLSFLA